VKRPAIAPGWLGGSLAAAIALGGLGSLAAADAPISPQAVDLAAIAAQSKTVAIADDQLRAALVKGTPDGVVFGSALDLGEGASAIAWSECSKAGCRGAVATLTGTPPRQVKRAALVAPAKVFFADGFAFEAPALADLDGDGAPEIVLHYTAVEPPRGALGSRSREYVAVYSKDLALLFSHELRRAGADTEEACQWTLARSGDRLIASGECNQRTCLESPAAGCKPGKKLVETWRKARGQKRYIKVAR
jgi:hypothetical protein